MPYVRYLKKQMSFLPFNYYLNPPKAHMKYINTLLTLGLIITSQLSAQIRVDFNLDGATPPPTQEGFFGVNVAQTANSITNAPIGDGILLSATAYGPSYGARNRSSTGLTFAPDFFRDGFTGNTGNGTDSNKDIDFTFSGLSAGLSYEITIWSWDNDFNNKNARVELVETTNGVNNVVGEIFLNETKPASFDDSSATFQLTASESGVISLDVFAFSTTTPSNGTGVMINGLSITPIPEPAIMTAAFVLGCLGLVYIRRSRR